MTDDSPKVTPKIKPKPKVTDFAGNSGTPTHIRSAGEQFPKRRVAVPIRRKIIPKE